MKLAGHKAVPGNHGGKAKAIFAFGHNGLPASGQRVVGMQGIEISTVCESFEHRVAALQQKPIPSHMWNLESPVGVESPDLAGQ